MYKEDGRTVLNIPVECLQFSPEEASGDKQMVERLEGKVVGEVALKPQGSQTLRRSFWSIAAAMIHWSDQVKETLTDHKPGESVLKKGWGPLQELDLWESRSSRLLDVEKQLHSSEVKHVLSILHISKSVYVQRFLRLTKEIQVGIIGSELLNCRSGNDLNLRCCKRLTGWKMWFCHISGGRSLPGAACSSSHYGFIISTQNKPPLM